ncbi:Cytosolic iron-sulfur protein assembly protein [Apiospora phragmitis]|uniref:Cytosolic iron-sulfur protein assembly protein n=1 Tax=Apiospora phragmitis TaxID=2905665 RepID=A0ABR1WVL5_9PEZI
MPPADTESPSTGATSAVKLTALTPFKPELYDRAWQSIPHPTLPLIATAHEKSTTVFSLSTLTSHSTLSGGHTRSVRSVAWKPNLSPHKLCLVSGSFDSTAGLWRWEEERKATGDDLEHDGDVKAVAWCPDNTARSGRGRYSSDVLASASYDDTVRIWREDGDGEWVCVAVLEGHAGTVWGLQWEPAPEGTRFPRLLTWSADQTLRLWTLKEDDDEDEGEMRRRNMLGAHTRDVYSASWSADSARIASTGSDGVIVVYGEEPAATNIETSPDEATVELDGDVQMGNNGNAGRAKAPASTTWKVLGTTGHGHGPFEINHVTWCKRYDMECAPERRGVEEMLVTTGDDGVVRPWQVS